MREKEKDLNLYFHEEKSDDYDPHDVAEVICLKCLKRHIAVYPMGTLLKDMECPYCEEIGYIIMTGQEVSE